MTCYLRHLKDLLSEIGVEVTNENKHLIDEQIHQVVGVEYKDCSTTWREVKNRLAGDREEFIENLKAALSGLL